MKNSRFTEEQIIGFLKQAEVGLSVKELRRQAGGLVVVTGQGGAVYAVPVKTGAL